MIKNKNILSLHYGLQILTKDLFSKYKDNYEGLFSELETLKKQSTQCSICKTKLGVVSSGLSRIGLRIFKTIENKNRSYFVCRQCLKNYNMVE